MLNEKTFKDFDADRATPWIRGRIGSCLLLGCGCLGMLSLRTSLRQRRQLRNEHQLEQTRWVLDAAIRKSIADPPSESSEEPLKPKLEKFDKVLVSVEPDEAKGQVVIRAKIENAAGTSVTMRSASVEAPDQ